jgi:hypothetical protein
MKTIMEMVIGLVSPTAIFTRSALCRIRRIAARRGTTCQPQTLHSLMRIEQVVRPNQSVSDEARDEVDQQAGLGLATTNCCHVP